MNEKSYERLTSIGMADEKYGKMLEEQERDTSFEDSSLEQFVKKPEESHLCYKVISIINSILLFFLFFVIFATCVKGIVNETIETYVAVPITVLAIVGIIILWKDMMVKNNKKHM